MYENKNNKQLKIKIKVYGNDKLTLLLGVGGQTKITGQKIIEKNLQFSAKKKEDKI